MSRPRSEVRVFADAEELSRAAAREFVRLAQQATAARGRFTVALAGGSTPRRVYELLAEPEHREAVDWGRVEFFWGDERVVAPEHPDSNYGMAAAALLFKLDLPAGGIHRIQAERPDRDAVAHEYQLEIARVLRTRADGPPPPLDLVLLGMGADGHTASLFPHTGALRERQRWVVRNYADTLRTDRVTLTYPIINAAREIRLLVAGAEKAPTLKAVLEGPLDPERLPSQGLGSHALWLVDRAAARDLGRPHPG